MKQDMESELKVAYKINTMENDSRPEERTN